MSSLFGIADFLVPATTIRRRDHPIRVDYDSGRRVKPYPAPFRRGTRRPRWNRYRTVTVALNG